MILEGTVNGTAEEVHLRSEVPGESAENEFIPRLWATRRVGYLLDEIRLHGENAELRDEVTELARKYGIVTPYTAYLIVEDETQRNVPTPMRSLQGFDTRWRRAPGGGAGLGRVQDGPVRRQGRGERAVWPGP